MSSFCCSFFAFAAVDAPIFVECKNVGAFLRLIRRLISALETGSILHKTLVELYLQLKAKVKEIPYFGVLSLFWGALDGVQNPCELGTMYKIRNEIV